MPRYGPALVLGIIMFAGPACAATSATGIVAEELEREGDRLGANRLHLAEAISLYDRAVALEDPPPTRLVKRSLLRLAAGDGQGAIADLTWALARPNVDREAALATRCSAHRAVGNRMRARADCEQALRLNPDDPRANGELAELEFAAGNIGAAWRLATTATEMDARNTRYESIRCRIAQQMSWTERIASTCARAQQIDVEDR